MFSVSSRFSSTAFPTAMEEIDITSIGIVVVGIAEVGGDVKVSVASSASVSSKSSLAKFDSCSIAASSDTFLAEKIEISSELKSTSSSDN